MSEDKEATLLDIRNLKTYLYTHAGVVRAVDDVNLSARKGEAVGLVGESGCGKTMTALSVMRLLPSYARIASGKICFDGINLVELTQSEMMGIRGGGISMVFQDPLTFLNPVLPVGRQIGETIRRHIGGPREEIEEKVVNLLEKVGVASPQTVKDYFPHQMSGGMRQRVLIAIALSCNPSLIIADEPTTALDVTVQAQILLLLRNLMEELKVSIVLITHDLGIVAEICDRVYVMYAGKIVEHGDVYSVLENSQHPYTLGLMESVLSIDEFRKDLSTIEGVVPSLISPPQGCSFHPRCPYALSMCSEREPRLVDVGRGHCASCLLFES